MANQGNNFRVVAGQTGEADDRDGAECWNRGERIMLVAFKACDWPPCGTGP
jgi:hypothetical protein